MEAGGKWNFLSLLSETACGALILSHTPFNLGLLAINDLFFLFNKFQLLRYIISTQMTHSGPDKA